MSDDVTDSRAAELRATVERTAAAAARADALGAELAEGWRRHAAEVEAFRRRAAARQRELNALAEEHARAVEAKGAHDRAAAELAALTTTTTTTTR